MPQPKKSQSSANQAKLALRLVDANLNRYKEGLRVCEDVLRFVYDDKKLTSSFKSLRHGATKAVLSCSVSYKNLASSRDSSRDVGKSSAIRLKSKTSFEDLVVSNLKRSEESLRVLEEVSKVIGPKLSREFQRLRFDLYELEKKVLKRI